MSNAVSALRLPEPATAATLRSADRALDGARRSLWVGLVTGCLALLLSACGGGSGSNSVIAPTALDYDPLTGGNPVFSFQACSTVDTAAPQVDQPITNWSSTPALPAGLSFASDGSLVGVPGAVTASANYLVVASNAAGSVQQTISIAITIPPFPAGLSYATNPASYTVGLPSVPNVPAVTGNITSWSISPPLPAGLSISATTGVISGTPTAASAAASYTVTAQDCIGGQTSASLSLSVASGGGGGLLDTPRFVYTANSGDGTVSINTLNPVNGKLQAAGYAVLSGTPVAIERSAGHDELFVLDQTENQVEVYSINPVSGQLTPIAGSPFGLPLNAAPSDFLLDGARARLFVANTGLNSISVFSVAANGVLTPVAGSPFALTGQEPVSLALEPNEGFLYAACRGSDQIAALTVAVSGALSGQQLFSSANSPQALDTLLSSTGNRMLYVGCGAGGNQVIPYTINPASGAITAGIAVTDVNGSISRLDAVQFSNGNRTLYALNTTLGRVQRLGVLGGGAVTIPLDSVPFYVGADPVAIARTDTDSFCFVVFQGEAAISSASVDAANFGVLTPVAPSESPTDRQRVRALPADVVVVNGTDAPIYSSDSVYAANFLNTDLAQYSFTPAPATLSPKNPATVAAGAGPNSIVVHPRLDKAYVINNQDTIGQDILVYDIAPNGNLITPPVAIDLALAGAAGAGGAWSAAIDPSGRFLIVTRPLVQESQVISYPLDASGNLGQGLAAAAGDTARGGAIDPTGRFFYVANSISNTIGQYSINPSTGALTSIAAPLAAGTGPWAVTVDPTGRFAYVASFSSNSLSAYAIDPVSGALSDILEAGGGPVTLVQGNQPVDLRFERGGRVLYVACEGSLEINRFLINLNPNDAIVNGTVFLFAEQSIQVAPRSLAIDGANGSLFAAISSTGEVRSYDFSLTQDVGVLTLRDTDQSAPSSGTRAVAVRTRLQ
jgi:6-phosphogluconolactonase (cycloisomerase 2 family)